ncbi:hypothetical protein CL644_00855 [bacterium]|nr:hypothetical protein [Parcubacteria group bacterium]MBF05243.1 hypothetical protein [bacterium]|tara:strand:- start:2563 stop:2916 length:354 start_codon:yes stop_codon:yes gene_type:complete
MEEQHNNTPPTRNSIEQPVHTDVPVAETSDKSGGTGPLVGIVIIVILLVFGGLYYWDSLSSVDAVPNEDTTVEENPAEGIATPNDEPNQIESDLGTFDTASFEAQLEADLESLELNL